MWRVQQGLLLLALLLGVSVAREVPPRRALAQRSRTLPALRTAPPSPLVAAAAPERSGWASAGGVAGAAIATEALQVANTAVAFLVLRRLTGKQSFVDLVEVVAGYFKELGLLAYPVYFAFMIVITVLPLMSAVLFIVLAGMLFGPLLGTAMTLTSLSAAAAIAAVAARAIARRRGFSLADIDAKAAAVDAKLAEGSPRTVLLLVTLLRLSPVMPYTFSNYLAGLTSVSPLILFIGTVLGSMPSHAAYVTAGALGRKALQGGVKLPPQFLALGVLATIAAIVLIGHVASSTLKTMDLCVDGEKTA